ncbi:hypothetical protein GCM10007199_08240 [Fictibacillus barbaricus]|nr:hypothetical protein GCM10007199_08240 [Fictibacillus barbaricus]
MVLPQAVLSSQGGHLKSEIHYLCNDLMFLCGELLFLCDDDPFLCDYVIPLKKTTEKRILSCHFSYVFPLKLLKFHQTVPFVPAKAPKHDKEDQKLPT